MKTVIIVPARQGSSRLPLKHLYPLVDSRNALELLRERLNAYPGVPGPIHLAVGQGDSLYEDLGVRYGYSDVFRSGFVKDGDLLTTLWEASTGFDRGICVYGDSPLINSQLVRDLLEHTGLKGDFGWVEGVPGLRPFVFHREFLREWRGRVLRESQAPFSLLRWPFSRPPLKLKGKSEWTIDTLADLAHLREFLAVEGPQVTLERILTCSR